MIGQIKRFISNIYFYIIEEMSDRQAIKNKKEPFFPGNQSADENARIDFD